MARNLLILIVIAAAGYFGYKYYQENKPELDQQLASLTEKVSESAPSLPVFEPEPAGPKFQSKIPIPEFAPGEKRVAPPGTFYMLERITVETSAGVDAINPGEEVKLLKRMNNGRMKMAQGANEFEVAESQVTNDLDRAVAAEKSEFVARGGKL